MERKVSTFVYWAPRVASILFIVFLSLFSLDVISPSLSLSQILIGMLIHNIPVFVLIVVLIISWKYEIEGGITFPAIVIGVLFMINWHKKRRKN